MLRGQRAHERRRHARADGRAGPGHRPRRQAHDVQPDRLRGRAVPGREVRRDHEDTRARGRRLPGGLPGGRADGGHQGLRRRHGAGHQHLHGVADGRQGDVVQRRGAGRVLAHRAGVRGQLGTPGPSRLSVPGRHLHESCDPAGAEPVDDRVQPGRVPGRRDEGVHAPVRRVPAVDVQRHLPARGEHRAQHFRRHRDQVREPGHHHLQPAEHVGRARLADRGDGPRALRICAHGRLVSGPYTASREHNEIRIRRAQPELRRPTLADLGRRFHRVRGRRGHSDGTDSDRACRHGRAGRDRLPDHGVRPQPDRRVGHNR
mmetsp:Transcript_60861/g.173060  ORF Transcript_60861/g.173060 Transcript_60861/m.173060 type:complete len:317 (-) Transcript_60861:2830-3780(-)